jgi:two-component system chemotaxis response regulator CheY
MRLELSSERAFMNSVPKHVEMLIASTRVLLIEDDHYMRKVIRSLLLANGITLTFEVATGRDGLDAICTCYPDVVLLDWELPDMKGTDLMRIVRAPGKFPRPDIPIIMLTGHVERERVMEAVRLGVNEFLRKPVSGKALLDRVTAVRARPRAMVQIGDYYGPEPRRQMAEQVKADDVLELTYLI